MVRGRRFTPLAVSMVLAAALAVTIPAASAATADPASNGNAISSVATASPGPAAKGTPIIRQCQALPRPPPRAAWAQASTSAGTSGNVRISGLSF